MTITPADPPKALTAAELADALGCFWNAAIGAAHRQQEGMAFASIMVEGIAAVGTRLQEIATAGLAEIVAVRHSFDGYGWSYIDAGSGSDWLKRGLSYPGAECLVEAPKGAA